RQRHTEEQRNTQTNTHRSASTVMNSRLSLRWRSGGMYSHGARSSSPATHTHTRMCTHTHTVLCVCVCMCVCVCVHVCVCPGGLSLRAGQHPEDRREAGAALQHHRRYGVCVCVFVCVCVLERQTGRERESVCVC